MTDGVPGHDPRRPPSGPTTRSARSASTGCAACRPSAASDADDDTLVLVCHASPGSQTAGLRPGARPDGHHRADRRAPTPGSSCCGHTHLPEVRDLGWKIIVNDGSAGLRLRRRPDGLVGARRPRRRRRHRRDPADRVRRPRGRQRDLGARACPATSTAPPPSAPGSSSDEPSVRRGRRHRDGRRHGARQRRRLAPGRASSPAGPASGRSTSFDPSRLTSQIAGEVRDFDASGVLDRKDQRRTDRYIQFGLVAAREAMDQAGLPDRLEGELAERTGRHPRHRASVASARSSTASRPTPCAARTGSARSSSRWASPTSARARSRSTSG